MSFRNFNAFAPSFRAGKIVIRYLQTNQDTGRTEEVFQSQNDKLPSTDMTDLEGMLKAGVSLTQVNCKLLNPTGTVGLKDPKSQTQTQTQTNPPSEE